MPLLVSVHLAEQLQQPEALWLFSSAPTLLFIVLKTIPDHVSLLLPDHLWLPMTIYRLRLILQSLALKALYLRLQLPIQSYSLAFHKLSATGKLTCCDCHYGCYLPAAYQMSSVRCLQYLHRPCRVYLSFLWLRQHTGVYRRGFDSIPFLLLLHSSGLSHWLFCFWAFPSAPWPTYLVLLWSSTCWNPVGSALCT